jgi:hypothetical protein
MQIDFTYSFIEEGRLFSGLSTKEVIAIPRVGETIYIIIPERDGEYRENCCGAYVVTAVLHYIDADENGATGISVSIKPQ